MRTVSARQRGDTQALAFVALSADAKKIADVPRFFWRLLFDLAEADAALKHFAWTPAR